MFPPADIAPGADASTGADFFRPARHGILTGPGP